MTSPFRYNNHDNHDNMHNTFELTCDLIRRPSRTPEDAGCQQRMRDILEPLGFVCETLVSNGVTNLWARRGSEAPLVCFAGHTDVVPPGPLDAWTSPPYDPEVRDGLLYGRGASDMKASLAAFVTAIEAFVVAYPDHRGSIALLITSDEEGVATDGTVKVVDLLEQRGVRIDHCIVGEPTCVSQLGDTIKNGRRGSLSGRLVVKGVQGHIAYPHLVKNPIHMVAPAIAEMAATQWDTGNEYFPPTSWQISNIHAGTGATNVVPGSVTIDFNFRHATASSPESLQQRVHALLERHGLDYDLDWEISPPYLTPAGSLVNAISAAIHEATGVNTTLSTSGGTSDGRFIARIASQVVEFGPVNASIHKINENIPVADLEPLSHIYRLTLQELLT